MTGGQKNQSFYLVEVRVFEVIFLFLVHISLRSSFLVIFSSCESTIFQLGQYPIAELNSGLPFHVWFGVEAT